MSFELLDTCELHDGWSDVLQAFLSEMSACDVLDIGCQVDARVLLRISIGGCSCVSITFSVIWFEVEAYVESD
jgi:hypothetical protein